LFPEHSESSSPTKQLKFLAYLPSASDLLLPPVVVVVVDDCTLALKLMVAHRPRVIVDLDHSLYHDIQHVGFA